MKRSIFALFLLAPLLAAMPASTADKKNSKHGFKDPASWAERWDDPKRNEWQKPKTVIRMLAVDTGQKIADIGAGTGYFTIFLSGMVGKQGTVYAVDIEQPMLDHIMARPRDYDNIVPVLAKPNDPKLPEGELDLVLIVNTWHHIDKRDRYIPLLGKSLADYGRVAIVDFREGDLPVGPPDAEKLTRAEVVSEFEAAGWSLSAESVALPHQYFLVFRPPSD